MPYYSCGRALIRDSQRFLLPSGAAWFGSRADTSYKAAGAARQTDSETHRDAAVLGRQCQLSPCRGLFCSARPMTLPPADWCGFISMGCGSSD